MYRPLASLLLGCLAVVALLGALLPVHASPPPQPKITVVNKTSRQVCFKVDGISSNGYHWLAPGQSESGTTSSWSFCFLLAVTKQGYTDVPQNAVLSSSCNNGAQNISASGAPGASANVTVTRSGSDTTITVDSVQYGANKPSGA